jgi:hypothetical protein
MSDTTTPLATVNDTELTATDKALLALANAVTFLALAGSSVFGTRDANLALEQCRLVFDAIVPEEAGL